MPVDVADARTSCSSRQSSRRSRTPSRTSSGATRRANPERPATARNGSPGGRAACSRPLAGVRAARAACRPSAVRLVVDLARGAVAGAASSFLGPQGQVHVLFNPLFVLVVWNLAMYAGMAVWGAVRRARRTAGARPPEIPGFAATVEPRRASCDRRVPWFSPVDPRALVAHRVRAAELTDKIRRKRTVLAAFGREWLKFTRPRGPRRCGEPCTSARSDSRSERSRERTSAGSACSTTSCGAARSSPIRGSPPPCCAWRTVRRAR